MKLLTLLGFFWALTVPAIAGAQPADFQTCLSRSSPSCQDVGGPLVVTLCPSGPRYAEIYYGRIAWYPLKCVGPITVAVETFAGVDTRFPIYVEVVPLPDARSGYLACENLTGYVILSAYGSPSSCGRWDERGPVDISHIVPLGSFYALRIYFFGHPAGESPAVDCIRVTSPVAVAPSNWAIVKSLFR